MRPGVDLTKLHSFIIALQWTSRNVVCFLYMITTQLYLIHYLLSTHLLKSGSFYA